MAQTLEEFKAKIQEKFKDSLAVIYPEEPIKWAKTVLECTCPHHGVFYKTPTNLLKSTGCPECAKYLKYKCTQEDFINRAKSIHNNYYTYEKTVYKGYKNKVIVTCPVHGDFEKRASDHLAGGGCAECGKVLGGEKRRVSFPEFKCKANKIHNNLYTYSEDKYYKVTDFVTITCQIHGDFEQIGYSHLRGNGCPICAKSGFDPSKPAVLYYLKVNGGQAYKLGITNKSVKERFSNSDLQIIEVLKTWYFEYGKECYAKEQKYLKEYYQYKYDKEPILESGNSELFNIDILGLDYE